MHAEDANDDADDTEGKITMSHNTVMKKSLPYVYRDADMVNDTEMRCRPSFFPERTHVGVDVDVNRSTDKDQLATKETQLEANHQNQPPELELKDDGLTDQVSMIAVQRDAPIAECAGAVTENQGVATRKQDEVRKFTHSPKFTYGMEGSMPKIDTNANPTIEMEMLDWASRDDLFNENGTIKAVMKEESGGKKPGPW